MRRLPIAESRSARLEELPPTPEAFARDGALPALTDARGRRYDYLRLSVTDRCDLACVYCMPPTGEDEHAVRAELLTFEEASRLIAVAAAMGIRRVRLTGGEPLVRKDVVDLVRKIRATTPVESIVMTTNATRLAELARPLADAGLEAVNVSIDSLDPARFAEITRGGDLAVVLAGLRAAAEVGLDIKTNAVALGGVNDDELGALVDFSWSIGATPRFIELMPLGEGAKLPAETRMTMQDVLARLGDRLALGPARGVAGHGPARYHVAADGSGRRVGFITPMSDEFCGTCNRVRITARGDIRACLASRKAISVRDVMRDGGDDRDVAWALTWSLSGKELGHYFLDEAIHEHENVGMSLIGG